MAQTLYDKQSNFQQSPTATEHTKNDFFSLNNFGFIKLVVTEQHGETWYPTPDVPVKAGWFQLDMHNAILGDINNDNLDDLILMPVLFTHIVAHPDTLVEPIILVQDGNGFFKDPQIFSESSSFPHQHMLYRLGVGDFNNDGNQDIAAAASSLIERSGFTYAQSVPELPVVYLGTSTDIIKWTQDFSGLSAAQYGYGHALAVGNFNGDKFDDFVSNRSIFYSNGDNSFNTKKLVASLEKSPFNFILSMTSADFNNDGYDDILYSPFHTTDNGDDNGGSIYLSMGSIDGLVLNDEIIEIKNKNVYEDYDDNRSINFFEDIDVNGDGLRDFVFIEHQHTKDDGDSSRYYTHGFLRMYINEGDNKFVETSEQIVDPYFQTRHGEGNIFVLDMNGDGWEDLVLLGFQPTGPSWGDRDTGSATSIFLNKKGVLELVDSSLFVYLDSYQIDGFEKWSEWQTRNIQKMFPIDLGDDGMVDFIGFVDTPLSQSPQNEPIYTYGYVTTALKPLGRISIDENLIGTKNHDKIFGYDGDDQITGDNGNDAINGGDGLDTATFRGMIDEYSVSNDEMVIIVSDRTNNRDGIDTLINIERIEFSDVSLSFDISHSANSELVYRIYQAAFARMPDEGGFRYWEGFSDTLTPLQYAKEFRTSAEFAQKYGSDVTNDKYTETLYRNVLQREPDAGGLSYWQGVLNSGGLDRDQLLIEFAACAENVTLTAPHIDNGYWLV